MVIPAQAEIEKVLVATPGLDHQIDRLGESIQRVIKDFFARQGPSGLQLRNFLNGVWLGHPLHAAITDLPVGAWTSGLVFDYLGALSGDRYLKSAGDWANSLGFIGGIGAAIAGLADYSELEDTQRRFGTVHGILNGLGIAMLGWSIVRRLSGDRSSAVSLSTLGYLFTFIGADLGGVMVYRYGTGVNRQALTEGPRQFATVLPVGELANGRTQVVQVNGRRVLLSRIAGQTYAIGNTCTHWGCSLGEGQIVDTSVKCHCHGSQFSLIDGTVINGPATAPEPTFEVREINGQIEIRERTY
jgi:nitrite reductase/ring-hydroxylating ferredoxin subunit/uncharacterized membrane protein